VATDTLPQNVSSRRLLPLKAVSAEFALHRTTIHWLVKAGKFPKPIRIGGSCRWIADEIEAFKAERMADR
jgi:predicted DNA-binding transcriptional regulator AlpA